MPSSSGVDSFLKRFESYAAPHYQEFKPASDLLPYVACTWVRVIRYESKMLLTAIIPDGCADIMIYDDQAPRVAGPDATTRWAALQDGLIITGIRLRPGAVRAVFGCSANLIANREVLLGDLVPGTARLQQNLLSTGDLQSRHLLLSDWVRHALTRAQARDLAVIGVCQRMMTGFDLEMGALARQLGWSSRTMHRHFIDACGYGPKHFQRIMRVQSAIRSKHSSPGSGLATIAAMAGYADQAHMTRDFRSITGFTPSAYIVATTPEFGAWITDNL